MDIEILDQEKISETDRKLRELLAKNQFYKGVKKTQSPKKLNWESLGLERCG